MRCREHLCSRADTVSIGQKQHVPKTVWHLWKMPASRKRARWRAQGAIIIVEAFAPSHRKHSKKAFHENIHTTTHTNGQRTRSSEHDTNKSLQRRCGPACTFNDVRLCCSRPATRSKVRRRVCPRRYLVIRELQQLRRTQQFDETHTRFPTSWHLHAQPKPVLRSF